VLHCVWHCEQPSKAIRHTAISIGTGM
jgi:hypothetical protein